MQKDAEIIGIWGGRGSGKTTRQKEMIDGKRRIIVLDPMEDFKLYGAVYCKKPSAVYRAVRAGWTKGFKIVLRPGHSEERCTAALAELTKGLFAIQQPYKNNMGFMKNREITLCIDEAHKFFPNPPHGEVKEPLNDLIALGRHYGIEMIGASQRLAKVWTEFRGNCSQHYFFRQGDFNDIQTAIKMIGPENKGQLKDLATHEYLHKGHGMNITPGRNAARF